jgi:hypothetical protein
MKKSVRRSAQMVVAGALVLAACGTEGSAPAPVIRGSWDRINQTILTPTCATGGCHHTGAPFAQSSGLALDRDVAYRNLISVAPKNVAAISGGYLRVKPRDSDKSQLYHKLVIQHPGDPDHDHGAAFGETMPLGGDPLLNGQVEFIKRWIDAGAPETGEVVDTMVLQDRSKQAVAVFVALPPPASGVQLRVDAFQVNPNFERELFVYRRVNNAAEIYVNRVETRMRASSHHFVLYTFQPTIPTFLVPSFDAVRDIRNTDGSLNLINLLPMGFHTFFAGAATSNSDYTFPPGVAMRVPAGAAFDLNTHYVNRTSVPLTGEVHANLHTVPLSGVQHVAQTLNMGNQDIVLPPKTRTTMTKTFINQGATMTVFMLTSHVHERGERFVIKLAGGARNGEVVYTSTDWQHPEITTYAAPIVLRNGEGLTSEVTWNNTTDRTIRFGLTSVDEMGIIFGYFYQ